MLGRHPRSLRWRQCAAPALALGLAGSAVLAAAGLAGAGAVLPAAYLLALVAGAALAGLRRRTIAAAWLPPVLATMHLAWAGGFWCATASRWRGTLAGRTRMSGPKR